MGSDPEPCLTWTAASLLLLQPCPEGHTGPPEGAAACSPVSLRARLCVQMLGVFSTFSLSDRTASRLLLFWVNE